MLGGQRAITKPARGHTRSVAGRIDFGSSWLPLTTPKVDVAFHKVDAFVGVRVCFC